MIILGIYNYIPETSPVFRVCSVAAILWLQFIVHVTLFPTFNVYYSYYYCGAVKFGVRISVGARNFSFLQNV
jgi:hypothetical protein